MKTHRFALQLAGLAEITDDQLNILYEAGCDDGTFAQQDGGWMVEFHREAATFAKAVASAISQIEGAAPALRVTRIVLEEDSLVTASEIARRVELSREQIRLLANGESGSGDFPKPSAILAGGQRLWAWSEVAEWFAEHRRKRFLSEGAAHSRIVRAFNSALELRALSDQVAQEDRAPLAEVVKKAELALA